VEHLLRDINDPSTSTLAKQIKEKVSGLNSFVGRLEDVRAYLEKVIGKFSTDRLFLLFLLLMSSLPCSCVVDGKMPVNNQINNNLQNILNMLPNLNVEALVRSMLVKTNDMYLAMYLAALVRSVIALHNLLNNKIQVYCIASCHFHLVKFCILIFFSSSRMLTMFWTRMLEWSRYILSCLKVSASLFA
jgi:26S proteasome regulatory subunit N8